MTITLDYETANYYQERIHALRLLKRFHDAGFDVSVASKFSLHYVRAFSIYEVRMLFEFLLQHIFPSIQIFEGYSYDENREIEKNSWMKNMVIPAPLADDIQKDNDFHEYTFYVLQSDLSNIDFLKAIKSATPILQNKKVKDRERFCIETDDGSTSFYLLNEKRDTLVFMLDLDNYINQSDPHLAFFISIYQQMQRDQERGI